MINYIFIAIIITNRGTNREEAVRLVIGYEKGLEACMQDFDWII